MPVFNTEEYLETAILSVLMQTYKNFELICIDDCSTDSSLDILEKFSALDSRIIIVKNNSNRGLSYNRNKGIDIAKGEYVLFLDSDDWLSFNTLEKLYSVAKPNNLDMLMFKFITYWEDLNTFSIEPFYDMKFMDKFNEKLFNHYDLEPNSLFDIPGAACNKLYSKDFLVKTDFKFPEGLIFEDTAIFFQNMINADRISLVDEYLYNRRRRKNSITTFTGEKLLDSIVIAKDLIEVFLNDKNIYNRYKNGALNITFSILRGKYNLIADEFKEEYFQRSKLFVQELINKYGLINDIENCLNDNNLSFYNHLQGNKNSNKYKCDLKNFDVYLGGELLISDFKFTDKFTNVFLDDEIVYNTNKQNFLTFIFKKLKEKCISCNDEFREENFQQCKYLVNKMYSEYDLYSDIKLNVDSNLLNFFNQDVI